ncbi:hypothetical protein M3Y97_01089900 [Aphelenchoides bicaudatus]|nr:hypothetical protein M3Y97_01089900 [Aphelenchoides bicaudatus]
MKLLHILVAIVFGVATVSSLYCYVCDDDGVTGLPPCKKQIGIKCPDDLDDYCVSARVFGKLMKTCFSNGNLQTGKLKSNDCISRSSRGYSVEACSCSTDNCNENISLDQDAKNTTESTSLNDQNTTDSTNLNDQNTTEFTNFNDQSTTETIEWHGDDDVNKILF